MISITMGLLSLNIFLQITRLIVAVSAEEKKITWNILKEEKKNAELDSRSECCDGSIAKTVGIDWMKNHVVSAVQSEQLRNPYTIIEFDSKVGLRDAMRWRMCMKKICIFHHSLLFFVLHLPRDPTRLSGSFTSRSTLYTHILLVLFFWKQSRVDCPRPML